MIPNMKKLTFILLGITILILGRVGDLCAQNTYNVPASGQNSITTCNAVIYDDGGASSNYSNYCNGSLVIHPSTPGNAVSITSGNYIIESSYDYVVIYSGVGTTGQELARLDGTGTVSSAITSMDPSGALTIYFHSDGSVQKAGFMLVAQCLAVSSMSEILFPLFLLRLADRRWILALARDGKIARNYRRRPKVPPRWRLG